MSKSKKTSKCIEPKVLGSLVSLNDVLLRIINSLSGGKEDIESYWLKEDIKVLSKTSGILPNRTIKFLEYAKMMPEPDYTKVDSYSDTLDCATQIYYNFREKHERYLTPDGKFLNYFRKKERALKHCQESLAQIVKQYGGGK